jgi:hypothetical protein
MLLHFSGIWMASLPVLLNAPKQGLVPVLRAKQQETAVIAGLSIVAS